MELGVLVKGKDLEFGMK